jgi:hypothetical protein
VLFMGYDGIGMSDGWGSVRCVTRCVEKIFLGDLDMGSVMGGGSVSTMGVLVYTYLTG